MARIRAFQPTDAVAIHLQQSQIGQMGAFEPVRNLRYGMELDQMGPAWTAVDDDGDILMCAGLGEVFPAVQATAWALIGKLGVHQLSVMRQMRRILDSQDFVRIEALARAAVPSEGQFLRLAGFRLAARLAKWGPVSEDYELYERVR